MRYLGIDPGQKGAWAVISEGGPCVTDSLPFIGKELDLKALVADLSILKEGLYGAVELPLAPQTSGTTTALAVGKNYGLMKAALIILEIPYEEVSSAGWKNRMKVTADKMSSISLALKLFPSARGMLQGPRGGWLDGRAEALLIAEDKRRRETRK